MTAISDPASRSIMRPVCRAEPVRVAGIDLLNWNTVVGRRIAAFLTDLEVGSEKLEATMVLAAPDLIDWAADEYAKAEHSGRAVLPTEVLNADGCRAFGRAVKIGWSGAALAVACSLNDALLVMSATAAAVGSRYGILVGAAISDAYPDDPAGIAFDLTLQGFENV